MTKDSTEQIKAALRGKPRTTRREFLSTGSTLLNLACTDTPFGGLMQGGYYCVIGDSSAGKTVLAGTCLAEAAMDPRFADYQLVFDDVEGGAMMFEKFYGPRIAELIQGPNGKSNSETVQEFYYHHHKVCEVGANVYVLDSENALTSDEERKKQSKIRKAMEDEEDTAGVMTDGKAKLHSQNLRGAVADVRDTKSILVLLCQSRDALGFGSQFEPKTRAGGRALKFYAQLEMWFSIVKHLTKVVRGKPREIGIIARVKVKKNRFTGKNRTVDIPIYHSFGIDDIGSCINYLIAEGQWKKDRGNIVAPEMDFHGNYYDLVRHIEAEGLEKELRMTTGEVWQSIEQACEVTRKPRYQ